MNTVIIDGLSFALPLFIMAIGGIYSEKSGITNLPSRACRGSARSRERWRPCLWRAAFQEIRSCLFYIAMLFAVIGGTLFSLIHALLCIRFKANMVISGVVINILAMAMTSFLTKQINAAVFGAASDKFVLGVSSRLTVPVISKIPVLGAVFSNIYPLKS